MSVDTIFQSFGPLSIGSIQVGIATGGSVADPTNIWKDMAFHWRLPHTLVGGTYDMRLAGQIYLPRHPKEGNQAYMFRVARSFLFPAYKQTVNSLAARPFAKNVTMGEDVNPQIKGLTMDLDLEGRNLTMFARDLLWLAIHDGMACIYVDYPVTKAQISLAEERNQGIRPFFRIIPMSDLIEVRSKRVGGRNILTRIRIHEQVTEADGDWGEVVNDYIRVVEADKFTLYKAIRNINNNSEIVWTIVDSGVNTLGYIPIVPIYANRMGYFRAYPALEEIAWLNLKHWQSQSDQDHILHIARVPILFGKGFDKESKEMEIGATVFITNSDTNADMKYVETTGAGIAAGAASLTDTERQMAILGYEPLLQQSKSSRMTATQRIMDNSQVESPLQAWVRAEENGMEQAFNMAADWMKIPHTDIDDHSGNKIAANVEINTDFPLVGQEVENLRTLLATRMAGDLSQETYLRALKRADILDETVDIKAEIATTKKEGPPAAIVAAGANNPIAGDTKTLGAPKLPTDGKAQGAVSN